MMGSTSRTFAIRRLICIDSFKPGAAVEIKLDGHTNINGDNGAGKTTLLRLIPAFFGVAPGEIVRKEGSNQSFVDHYLPRVTSYIIYEYRRSDQICQALICRPQAKDAVARFRFVDDSFHENDYRTDDGEIIPSGALSRHLTKNSVEHSNLLTQKQFRRIIQFNKSVRGNENPQQQRELNQLAGRYAFCETNSDIGELDRVIGSILERDPSFDAIKDVLCAVIDSEEASSGYLEPNLSRKQVEQWIKDCQAYKVCAGQAPRVEDLQLEARKLESMDAKAQSLHGIAHVLNETLLAQQKTLSGQLESAQADINRTTDESRAAENQFHSKSSALSNEIEARSGERDVLESQRETYDKQNIEQKRQAHERVPAMVQHIAQLTQDLEKVKSGAQDTEQVYVKLRHKEETTTQSRIDDRRKSENSARKESAKRLQAIRDDFCQRRDRCNDEHASQQLSLSKTKETSLSEYFKAEAELNSAAPNVELKLAETAKQRELNALVQSETSLLEAVHHADKALQKHNDTRQLLTDAHQELIENGISLSEKIDHLKTVIDADSDTLLGFLRSEYPAWTENIAKLVPESVLMRTDLKPQYLPGPGSDLLYGIQLELGPIEPPAIASVQQLQTDLQALEFQHGSNAEAIARSEKEIREFDSQRSSLERNKRHALQAQDELKGKISGKAQEVQSIALQIEQELERRKATLRDHIERARLKLEADTKALTDCEDRYKATLKALDKEERNAQLECDTALQTQLSHLASEIQQIEQGLEKKLAQLDQRRLEDLADKGVDTNAIKLLEGQLDSVQKQHDKAVAGYGIVFEYDHWLSTHWVRHSVLESRINELTIELNAITTTWSGTKAQFDAKIAQLTTHQNELNTQHGRVSNELSVLGGLLQNMQHVPLSNKAPEIDTSHTVPLLQSQWRDCTTTTSAIIKRGKRIYTELANTFASVQGEPSRAWQLMRDDIDPNISEYRFWHAAVPGIVAIFENELPVLQDNLLQQAKRSGHTMVEFYGHLKDLDRAIKSKGRQLSEQINGGMRFEAIDKLEVRLHSTVTEIDYWPVLDSFQDQYHKWESQGFAELPDADMTEMFNRVTELLSKGGHRTLKDLFTIDLSVVERGKVKRATSDKQLETISSTGLSYLILILILVGLVNLLRQRSKCVVLWPVDELGNFAKHNSTLLLSLLKESNIFIVSAFPDPDPMLLKHYKHAYYVDKGRTILQFTSQNQTLSEQVLQNLGESDVSANTINNSTTSTTEDIYVDTEKESSDVC